jgi:hypothetical protein
LQILLMRGQCRRHIPARRQLPLLLVAPRQERVLALALELLPPLEKTRYHAARTGSGRLHRTERIETFPLLTHTASLVLGSGLATPSTRTGRRATTTLRSRLALASFHLCLGFSFRHLA